MRFMLPQDLVDSLDRTEDECDQGGYLGHSGDLGAASQELGRDAGVVGEQRGDHAEYLQ